MCVRERGGMEGMKGTCLFQIQASPEPPPPNFTFDWDMFVHFFLWTNLWQVVCLLFTERILADKTCTTHVPCCFCGNVNRITKYISKITSVWSYIFSYIYMYIQPLVYVSHMNKMMFQAVCITDGCLLVTGGYERACNSWTPCCAFAVYLYRLHSPPSVNVIHSPVINIFFYASPLFLPPAQNLTGKWSICWYSHTEQSPETSPWLILSPYCIRFKREQKVN